MKDAHGPYSLGEKSRMQKYEGAGTYSLVLPDRVALWFQLGCILRKEFLSLVFTGAWVCSCNCQQALWNHSPGLPASGQVQPYLLIVLNAFPEVWSRRC